MFSSLFSAVGAVIPFLTVYLQHVHLSAPETGAVMGIAVLAAFLVRPLLGLLADWFRSPQILMAICCMVFGTSMFLIW